MRIAIAFDCLFPWSTGGGERLYRVFAEEFAAAGHEVTYLTRQQWDGDPPVVDGFAVEVVSTDRDLYDATGARTLGPALRFARGLFTHFRRNRGRYDAVLVCSTPSTNVLAVRAALAGSSTVVAVDWLELWRPEQWREYSGPVVGRVASTLQRVCVRLSPIACCHSQLMAGRLRASGLRGEPVVSPGLIQHEGPVAASLATVDPPRAIYVGRHIPDKHVETIPAAIAHARTRVPNLTATIFGEGQTTRAVLDEIARHGLGEVITTPGFVGQDELDEAMRTASCLVNPSSREGYGLVVVEACAVGTPAVLVHGEDNAAVELVEDGVNGTVAATTSPADLGTAIADVVEAGEVLRKSTLAWFENASRSRTVRAAGVQILSTLERAVAGAGR